MLKLQVLDTPLAICRFSSNDRIPNLPLTSVFFCVVRTADELSVVCDDAHVPREAKSQRRWRAFRVSGTLDFNLTGILSSIAAPLAKEKISIFAISTYDTDYILVKESDLDRSCMALRCAGFIVIE